VLLNKLVIIVTLISIIIFGSLGCMQNKELTLIEIEKLIFTELESVSTIEGFPGRVNVLNDEQIKILRNVIRNGQELIDITNGVVPGVEEDGNIQFEITKMDRNGINIIYCRRDGFCYVSKIQVNYQEEERYIHQKSLIDIYLKGIYKFRPSKEIEKLFSDRE